MAKERFKTGSFVSRKNVLTDAAFGAQFVSVKAREGRGLFPVDSKTDYFLEVHTPRLGIYKESTVYLRKGVVQEDGVKMKEISGSMPVTVWSITESGAAKKALKKYAKEIKAISS